MSIIKRGIVKSYDAANHKADVQIAGSLGVWLDGIRVATDIPAADVVPGRQCTVLFLDPSNQDDALVLTIQGALPSGGGGGQDPLIAGAMVPGALTAATEPPHVPAYYAATAEEIYLRYTSGSASSVQVTIKHFNEAGTQQNSKQLNMGGAVYKVNTSISWTVTKNDYFECIVDSVSGGSPKDLVWQVRP